MAKKEKAPAPAEATSAAAAAPKERAAGPRGVPQDAIIVMQADKKDPTKVYGPDHNPKRPGSAGHARFALYEDRMTVAAAIAKGIWAADITWDVDKGFIRIEGGTAAAPAPAASAEADPVAEGDEAKEAAAA